MPKTTQKFDGYRCISVSQFKDNFGEIIHSINKTGKPLVLTSHGRPVCYMMPAGRKEGDFVGSGIGKVSLKKGLGGLMEPLDEFEQPIMLED